MARTLNLLVLSTAFVLSGCTQNKSQVAEMPDHCEMDVMKKSAAGAAAPSAKPIYAVFGAPGKLSEADAMPVETLMGNPNDFAGKYVRLTGTVDKVCARKGCWLTLKGAGAGESLFVKFPDPAQGRLIPMEAVGKPAIVEGTVRVREIPEEVAKHYAEESGATPEQLAKITGPQKQITVASPSAQVADVKSGQDQMK